MAKSYRWHLTERKQNTQQYELIYNLLILRWVRSLLVSILVATRARQNKFTSTFTLRFLVADIIVRI